MLGPVCGPGPTFTNPNGATIWGKPDQYTDDWLQERLAYWARVMDLGGWHIVARWIEQGQMENAECVGRTKFQPRWGTVGILIVTPQSVRPWDMEGHFRSMHPYDPEQTLVHELVHLLWYHQNRDEDQDANEAAIENTANAMIRLERAKAATSLCSGWVGPAR